MTNDNFRGEAEIKGDDLLVRWGIHEYTLTTKNLGRIRVYNLSGLGLVLNVDDNPTIVLFDSNRYKGTLARFVYDLSKICKTMNIEFLHVHDGNLTNL